MIEITVIVPIYNRGYCLRQCLDSIKNQSFEDWECILIDDGSTDDSLAVCREYVAQDTRFHVYHQTNQGVSIARNKALDVAQGQYVNFVDSDDYPDRDCLRKLHEAMEENDWGIGGLRYFVDGVCTEEYYCKDMIVCPDIRYEKEFVDMEERGLLNGPCCKLYKRSIIEKNKIRFQPHISYGEDVIFNFTYLIYISSVRVLKECLYNVIATRGSLCLSFVYTFDTLDRVWKARAAFYTSRQLMTKRMYSSLKRIYCLALWIYLAGVMDRHDSLSALERYRFVRDTIRESDRARMKGYPYSFWRVLIMRNGVMTWSFLECKYLLLHLLRSR